MFDVKDLCWVMSDFGGVLEGLEKIIGRKEFRSVRQSLGFSIDGAGFDSSAQGIDLFLLSRDLQP